MPEDWTFNGASTRELTHCYHDYPARMIPQLAGRLLDKFASDESSLLFDPYCGTGTLLVEGLIRGLNAIGTDLNPLARLIARAKTSVPDLREIDDRIARFNRFALRSEPITPGGLPSIPGITRLGFWFKPTIVEKLLRLKSFIDETMDESVRLFFQIAFSETVRESSNTRNAEFKLYRYDKAKLAKFSPDVFAIMASKLRRNREGLSKFAAIMRTYKHPPVAQVYDFDTVAGIPEEQVAPASVDIVITSPPYGDSHTTVAYGQYSRLSAAWLGLEEPDKIDRKLMGGRINKKVPDFPCELLNTALKAISRVADRRARQVASFYADLYDSISHVAHAIKPGGYACYVVGNRKVKGIVLPTDNAIRCFFEHCEFEHVETFHRSIPNKRMPLRNSPTNAPGVVDSTMTQEHVVVMRRRTARVAEERGKKTDSRSNGKPR